MIAKIKELFFKYEEIIVYLIVGGITTVISWASMFFVNIMIFGNPLHPTAGQNFVLSTVNWVSGTASAYPMNRKLVFKSKDPNILAELSKFLMGRVSTYIMEVALRQIFGALGVNMFINSVICAIMVIVGNYIFSKLLVFRKK